jgi:hypothetical protein
VGLDASIEFIPYAVFLVTSAHATSSLAAGPDLKGMLLGRVQIPTSVFYLTERNFTGEAVKEKQ